MVSLRVFRGAHPSRCASHTRMLDSNLEPVEMLTLGSAWRFTAQQDTSLLTLILQCHITNSLCSTLGIHCPPNVGACSCLRQTDELTEGFCTKQLSRRVQSREVTRPCASKRCVVVWGHQSHSCCGLRLDVCVAPIGTPFQFAPQSSPQGYGVPCFAFDFPRKRSSVSTCQ